MEIMVDVNNVPPNLNEEGTRVIADASINDTELLQLDLDQSSENNFVQETMQVTSTVTSSQEYVNNDQPMDAEQTTIDEESELMDLDKIFMANLPKTGKEYQMEWSRFVKFSKANGDWTEKHFVNYFQHLLCCLKANF